MALSAFEPSRSVLCKLLEHEAPRGLESRLSDLHLWRLGLGAIIAVTTARPRGPEFYRARLNRFRSLSHLTVEVQRPV